MREREEESGREREDGGNKTQKDRDRGILTLSGSYRVGDRLVVD